MAREPYGIGKVDPYRNFRFLVVIQGNTGKFVSAGFQKVSGLISEIDAIMYREGGDNTAEKPYPGMTKYEPLTLERGMTDDWDAYNWFKSISDANGGGTFNPERKTLIIYVLGKSKEPDNYVAKITINRAWVSKFEIGDLDAKGNEILIERMVIQHEGWVLEELKPSQVNN